MYYFCVVRLYLKEWRTLREMSQRELGKKANVAYKTISLIEAAPEEPRQAKVVGKLSRALGIRPEELSKPPKEVETEKPLSEKSVDEMTPDEILSHFTRIRMRGNLTAEQAEEVALDAARQILKEFRERKRND